MSSNIRRGLVVFAVVPAAVFIAAYLVSAAPYSKYSRGIYEVLAFVLIADLAVGLRGGWRNVATIVAATVFGLGAIELASAAMEPTQTHPPRGLSEARPILGWGPSAPGVYHVRKTGPGGNVIYDVNYTIDKHLLRRTLSTANGASIAFFGDSFIFGEGLNDSETLPQDYADLTGRTVRVLNFGFSGYGPQQFLRALETGLFDPLLADTKTFVLLTAAWHIDRTSCRAGFVTRAPRYALRNGQPVFMGACAEGWKRVLRDFIVSSASFRRFVRPVEKPVGAADVELYLAELRRCAELVKQKYGGRLIILYLSESDPYLAKSGFTDAEIKRRLQHAGIELIDASLSSKNFPPGTLLNIPGDGHPTAVADRARAVLLQTYLAQSAMPSGKSAAE